MGAVTAVLLALVLPSSGAAQTPLPVGEAKGVRIVRERGALVLVFTQRAERLRRRVAGKLVTFVCTEFMEDGTAEGVYSLRAPKRGRRIDTGDRTRGIDLCRVHLAARTVRRDGESRRIRRKLLVSIPLTQPGAVHLDEQEKALTLLALLSVASLIGEDRGLGGYPTPAELDEALPGYRPRPGRPQLVALAGPSDTPPSGAAGYYSDGAQHAAGVIVSASGRRLFLEFEGDVLHTNLTKYLFNPLE